jgi:polysaccharide biosynthesis protein PelD
MSSSLPPDEQVESSLRSRLPAQPQGKMTSQGQFTNSPLGLLAQSSMSVWVILGETLLLPMVALAIGLRFHPEDPLWSHGDFPWSWIAPIVVALRYGPLAGLGSSVVLLLAWLFLNQGNYSNFPQVFFLGGLITVMLVGEFSSLWRARTRRAETMQFYLDQRLDHLIRQYYLLRLSHDRLEQELIGRPMSMRDALKTLRNLGGSHRDGYALLQLLAQYCQITVASLHQTKDDNVLAEAVAVLGEPITLSHNDPLVLQAIETRKLCHVAQATTEQTQTNYLAAAPLLDLSGEIYGVLAIEEMPFFALQEENLQTINLLLGYYTDGLAIHALASPIQAQAPDCPTEFAFELQRLWHMQQATGVQSVIVALEFSPAAMMQNLPEQVLRLKRMLDEAWSIQSERKHTLAFLMPLGDNSAVEGFLNRLEIWISQKSGTDLATAGIFSHTLLVQSAPPLSHIQRLLTIAHA